MGPAEPSQPPRVMSSISIVVPRQDLSRNPLRFPKRTSRTTEQAKFAELADFLERAVAVGDGLENQCFGLAAKRARVAVPNADDAGDMTR